MKKIVSTVFVLVLFLTGGVFFVPADDSADKVSMELKFAAEAVAAASDGKISIDYEGTLWDGRASFLFGDVLTHLVNTEISEMFASPPLFIDEPYVSVKHFGGNFKFTADVFENTKGAADCTDDIDGFAIGTFLYGDDCDYFYDSDNEHQNAALSNGSLADTVFDPLTLQLLLALNFSKEDAAELYAPPIDKMYEAAWLPNQGVTADERFFRLGYRGIADTRYVQTFTISNVNWTTFGAHLDFTAAENPGVFLGYTGPLPVNAAPDVDNVLCSGADIRANCIGGEWLIVSAHNKLSFAQGAERDWTGALLDGNSFFNVHNNAEIANVLSKTDSVNFENVEFESFWAKAKLITRINEAEELMIGLKLDSGTVNSEDAVNMFSVPLGISVSF
jgi:hypothetical protein